MPTIKLRRRGRLRYGVKPYCKAVLVNVSLGQARKTERAIISSSSVRMTRTVTRLAFLEITAAVFALRDLSSSMPRKFKPFTDARADDWRIFADAAGENERVQSTERGGKEPIHFFA